MTQGREQRLVTAAGARRARAVVAAVLLLPNATGCYTAVPVRDATPPAGQEIVVGITDRGRVALAGPMGPGVRRIQGRLVQATDSALTISVSKVEYLDAARSTPWTGERVTVGRDYVSNVDERRFSRSRTWIAVGVVALAAVAVTTISLRVTGSEAGGNTDKGGGQQQ